MIGESKIIACIPIRTISSLDGSNDDLFRRLLIRECEVAEDSRRSNEDPADATDVDFRQHESTAALQSNRLRIGHERVDKSHDYD